MLWPVAERNCVRGVHQLIDEERERGDEWREREGERTKAENAIRRVGEYIVLRFAVRRH